MLIKLHVLYLCMGIVPQTKVLESYDLIPTTTEITGDIGSVAQKIIELYRIELTEGLRESGISRAEVDDLVKYRGPVENSFFPVRDNKMAPLGFIGVVFPFRKLAFYNGSNSQYKGRLGRIMKKSLGKRGYQVKEAQILNFPSLVENLPPVED